MIVFFNTGLVACVLRMLNGEDTPLSYGLSFAVKRIPQIIGWALVSAVIGVILRIIEKSNEHLGHLIAALFGSAWTALAYFVAPVIVVEGVGPIKAFKRSIDILKTSWGTTLISNFSLGLVGFVLILPAFLIVIGVVWFATVNGYAINIIIVAALITSLILIDIALMGSVDGILQTHLYLYATQKDRISEENRAQLTDAFKEK